MFLRQLEYLTALDRERHFGRAAAACHAAQPTLSAGIRSLERELGVPLVRRGRAFEGFTPEGELILGWAQRAMADLESLRQEASRLRGGLEGTLRIGAIPTSLPLSPLVTARFRERHPRMRMRLISMSSRQIAHGLEHGEIEAGLTYLDNEPLARVDTVPLWREHYLLVTAAGEDFGETVAWAEAAELPLCLLTPDMQHRRIVDGAFATAGATPHPAVETNSVSTLIAHARTGLPGITAHTWLQANPLPEDLRAIPLVAPEIEHTIGLVTATTIERTPVITELLDLFAPLELDSMSAIALFWFLPGLVALAACALGHYVARTGRRWPNPIALAVTAVLMLTFVVIAVSGRDPEVSDGQFAEGVAIAALGLGALPWLVFYTIGYLVPYAWAVAMLWLVGSIGLGFYMVIGAIIVAGFVSCPPDAYECPL